MKPTISKSTLFTLLIIAIALLLSSGPSGCSARKKENLTTGAGAKSQVHQPVPTPAPEFKIVLARGGGFTALWHGYSLYPDGRVENWQRFGAQADSILWSGQAGPEEIEQFRQELFNSGILEREIRHWGNLSQSVSYVTPDTTRIWAWTDDDENQLPGEFKDWYNRIQEFCARQKNNQP